jgi:hypothetical protein
MEQRTLRLGDIVDDYCPRERRITNHAVVAIVENAIRQTRCTTCDHEHPFKQAREPRRRKKTPESLYDQVLADVSGAQLVASDRQAEDVAEAAVEGGPAVTQQADETETVDAEPPQPSHDEAWPAHRTLIRATLPKTDEPPPPRPIPEFTMHQKPQPVRGRGAFRLAYGPQGDPFGAARDGRPGRPPNAPGRGPGVRNGSAPGGGHGSANGNDAGPRRGRRRGGKRSR